jgi:hypothetical protein
MALRHADPDSVAWLRDRRVTVPQWWGGALRVRAEAAKARCAAWLEDDRAASADGKVVGTPVILCGAAHQLVYFGAEVRGVHSLPWFPGRKSGPEMLGEPIQEVISKALGRQNRDGEDSKAEARVEPRRDSCLEVREKKATYALAILDTGVDRPIAGPPIRTYPVRPQLSADELAKEIGDPQRSRVGHRRLRRRRVGKFMAEEHADRLPTCGCRERGLGIGRLRALRAQHAVHFRRRAGLDIVWRRNDCRSGAY